MKNKLLLLGVCALVACTVAACHGKSDTPKNTVPETEQVDKHAAHPDKKIYICPMHPQITSDKPGSCPICGMDLVLKQQERSSPQSISTPAGSQDKKNLYICPMHPQITSDKPGSCPICGMDLVLKQQEPPSAGTSPDGLAPVYINEAKRGIMGLTFGTVAPQHLTRQVRTSARIVPDETRLYRVTTKVEGYVEKLYVNVTGQEVKKGQPLLSIYSPELVASQQEFLTALPFAEHLSHSSHESIARSGSQLVEAARKRLQLWDITDAQIDRLAKTGQVEKTLTLFAPASGYVMEKAVLPGQKITPGEALLVIADLTTVWAEADLYESDIPYVTVGMPVTLTLPYWQRKEFHGHVSFLFPYLDPKTRTLRARMNIENPELLLKGDMYGDAHLRYELGERLAVPETAVMQTGIRSYAFKAGSGDEILPVEVKLGTRTEGWYEVLAGLAAGDQVVTSANFLVDSESSLKAALQAITGGGQ